MMPYQLKKFKLWIASFSVFLLFSQNNLYAGNIILRQSQGSRDCASFSVPYNASNKLRNAPLPKIISDRLAELSRQSRKVRAAVHSYTKTGDLRLPVQLIIEGHVPHTPILINVPRDIAKTVQDTLRGSRRILSEIEKELATYNEDVRATREERTELRSTIAALIPESFFERPDLTIEELYRQDSRLQRLIRSIALETPDSDSAINAMVGQLLEQHSKLKQLATHLLETDFAISNLVALIKDVTSEVHKLEAFFGALDIIKSTPEQLRQLNKGLFIWLETLRNALPSDAQPQKAMPNIERLQDSTDPAIASKSQQWIETRNFVHEILIQAFGDIEKLSRVEVAMRTFGQLDPSKSRDNHINHINRALKLKDAQLATRVYEVIYDTEAIQYCRRFLELETEITELWGLRNDAQLVTFRAWTKQQVNQFLSLHDHPPDIPLSEALDVIKDHFFRQLRTFEGRFENLDSLRQWIENHMGKGWLNKFKNYIENNKVLPLNDLKTALYLDTLAKKPYELIELLTKNQEFSVGDPEVLHNFKTFGITLAELRKAKNFLRRSEAEGNPFDEDLFHSKFPNITRDNIFYVFGPLFPPGLMSQLPDELSQLPGHVLPLLLDNLPTISQRFKEAALSRLDQLDPDQSLRQQLLDNTTLYPNKLSNDQAEDTNLALTYHLLNVISTCETVHALDLSYAEIQEALHTLRIKAVTHFINLIEGIETKYEESFRNIRPIPGSTADGGNDGIPQFTQRAMQVALTSAFRRFHPGIEIPPGVKKIVLWIHGQGTERSRVITLETAISMTASLGPKDAQGRPAYLGIGLSGPQHGGPDDVHTMLDYVNHLNDVISYYKEQGYEVGIVARSAGGSVGAELMYRHPESLDFSIIYSHVLPRGFPEDIRLDSLLSSGDLRRITNGEITWTNLETGEIVHTLTLHDIAREKDGVWYIDQLGYNIWVAYTNESYRARVNYDLTLFADRIIDESTWIRGLLSNPEQLERMPPTLFAFGQLDEEYEGVAHRLYEPHQQLIQAGWRNAHYAHFTQGQHQLYNPRDNEGFRSVMTLTRDFLAEPLLFDLGNYVGPDGNAIDPLLIPTDIRRRE